jgi:predicted ferric reductase
MTTTTLQRTPAPAPRAGREQRSGGPRRTRVGDLAALVAGVGGGLTAAITAPVILATSWSAPGAVASALGIVTAMAGTYLALLSLLLMARLPWLEHEVGQDRLTAWHRNLGPWTLVLIVAHVVLTTLGYAQSAGIGWWDQLVGLTFGYPWMLPAAVATVLMIGLGVMSWRRIRSRMRYETWHVAHLYFYLAVALGFGHQLESGSVFANAPLATAWWVGLYVAIALTILAFRFGAPILQSLRHGPRVAAVVPVTSDVAHVYVTGRDLDRLGAQGGQWFSFRFGTRRWWWQGHPYSLSAAPTAAGMRITVKNLGDQSSQLLTLEPGTRVFVEGPYGAFRADQRRTDRLVLVGAGIGITPIRALLDELPADVQADVVYRVHEEPAPLADELGLLARRSQGRIRLHLLVGSRREHPMSARTLAQACPDIAESDVYVCGPIAFVEDVIAASTSLGVDADRIHHELFAF